DAVKLDCLIYFFGFARARWLTAYLDDRIRSAFMECSVTCRHTYPWSYTLLGGPAGVGAAVPRLDCSPIRDQLVEETELHGFTVTEGEGDERSAGAGAPACSSDGEPPRPSASLNAWRWTVEAAREPRRRRARPH